MFRVLLSGTVWVTGLLLTFGRVLVTSSLGPEFPWLEGLWQQTSVLQGTKRSSDVPPCLVSSLGITLCSQLVTFTKQIAKLISIIKNLNMLNI